MVNLGNPVFCRLHIIGEFMGGLVFRALFGDKVNIFQAK